MVVCGDSWLELEWKYRVLKGGRRFKVDGCFVVYDRRSWWFYATKVGDVGGWGLDRVWWWWFVEALWWGFVVRRRWYRWKRGLSLWELGFSWLVWRFEVDGKVWRICSVWRGEKLVYICWTMNSGKWRGKRKWVRWKGE